MSRPAASRRTVLALAVPLALGTAIGVAAPTLWSASGSAATPPASAAAVSTPSPSAVTAGPDAAGAAATTPTQPTTPSVATSAPAAPNASPLSLPDALAVAVSAVSGRVVEAKEDTEVTGLTYDVSVARPDGLVTELAIDAATGHVLSSKIKD
ncbi:MAG: PepSY domain-containing protein [Actinomycetes bacterium]